MNDLPAVETALSRFTRGLLHHIAGSDATRRELLERTDLDTLDGPFSDGAARLVWQVASEIVPAEDDALGLQLAASATMEEVGVLGYLARASATFGEACTRAVQFERLLKGGTDVYVETDSVGAHIVDSPSPGRAQWPRHLAEAIMALWWLWPQRWSGVSAAPMVVRFQHARPVNTRAHDRLFGCPLEFAQPRNEVVVSSAVWALPLPSADALLGRYLLPVVEGEVAKLSAEDPLLSRARERLVEMMPSGTFDVNRLARALGLSRRTLHRRLRERGLTYEALVDDLRRQTALRLYEARQHSHMEIAFLIGFSDASSLRRASQRWARSGLWRRAADARSSKSSS